MTRARRPDLGRRVALATFAALASLGAGALIAADTVATIDPLYRQGRPPSRREPPRRTPTEPVVFTPIRWSGFAAAPPARDPYDDPALLAEPQPYREPDPPAVDTDAPAPDLPPGDDMDTALDTADAP